jgi:molybdopterin synthase catalytic subunit
VDATVVRVTGEPLDLREAAALVADPGAGGTCIFSGTVRDHSSAGPVVGLRYEAWEDLALRRLADLAADLHGRWPLRRVAILHRIGDLAVGEISVIVAVAAAHRAEAFEACREGIERLKDDVPVWKQEQLADGTAEWVLGS